MSWSVGFSQSYHVCPALLRATLHMSVIILKGCKMELGRIVLLAKSLRHNYSPSKVPVPSLQETNSKNPKNYETRKIAVIILKTEQCGLNTIFPDNADGMANSVDPRQTLIRVCTVCTDLCTCPKT